MPMLSVVVGSNGFYARNPALVSQEIAQTQVLDEPAGVRVTWKEKDLGEVRKVRVRQHRVVPQFVN